MALVILGSAKGSPGVTTTAVALARFGTGSAVVVECDCWGGDLAARYCLVASPGVLGWASTVGARGDLWGVTRQYLPETGGRAGVVVGGVGDWEALAALDWPQLAVAMDSAEELVLADVGRLGAGCFEALAPRARVIVLVARRELSALSHLRGVLRWVRQLAPETPLGLVMVGERGLWSDKDVGASLGVKVLGALPWVDALARPPTRAGLPDLRPLARAGAEICERLSDVMRREPSPSESAPEPAAKDGLTPVSSMEMDQSEMAPPGNNQAARTARVMRKERSL